MAKTLPAFASLAFVSALVGPRLPAQPVGLEFHVNTYTTSDQLNPDVTCLPTGTCLVVYTSFDGTGGIYAQRFAATGAPLGSELRVSTGAAGTTWPRVAASTSGFTVVWQASVPGRLASFGRRYDGAGNGIGGEFSVSANTSADSVVPDVSHGPGGGFVAVWESGSATDRDVFARRFSDQGAPYGSEIRVNTYTTGRQKLPNVAVDAAGNFLVCWIGQDGSGYGIVARVFDASGNPLSGEIPVNEATDGDQAAAAVAAIGKHAFVVSWEEYGPQSQRVLARRVSDGGTPLGPQFTVSEQPSGYTDRTSIASDSSGDFVVVWRNAAYEISARRYAVSGASLGPEFRVNTYTTGSQVSPAVGADSAGRFVVAWASLNQPGDALYGIFAQRFASIATKGDVDGNGVANVADVFYLINHLFAGGPDPLGPADMDGDGASSVADVFYLINFLFAGGPAPV